MNLPKRLAYLKLSFLIGLISVYDTALIVIYGDEIYSSETNPVGNWLMGVGGIPLFTLTKAVLTICAVSLCMLVARTKYRVAILVVLSFQLLLFWWLTFSTVAGGGSDYPNPLTDVVRFYTCGQLP
jgi:hypothetical protein